MRLSTLRCASLAVVFLACTSSDIPTQPESIAAAKSLGPPLTQVDLGLPDVWSAAFALNNLGQVVGTRSSEFEGPGPAFLWDRGTVTDEQLLPVDHAQSGSFRRWLNGGFSANALSK